VIGEYGVHRAHRGSHFVPLQSQAGGFNVRRTCGNDDATLNRKCAVAWWLTSIKRNGAAFVFEGEPTATIFD